MYNRPITSTSNVTDHRMFTYAPCESRWSCTLTHKVHKQSGLPGVYSHRHVAQVHLGWLRYELPFADQKFVVRMCWRGLDLLKLLYTSARDVKHMQVNWQDCP